MSFVSALALLIGVLVVVPLLAHLFQRGRARTVAFPPTRWVVAEAHVATRPKRVDDIALLVVRMGLVLLLAVLGAVPLVRCNEKRLDRAAGASVARVLVIDDSGSMGATQDRRRTRFDVSLAAARSLVGQMREGDSVGIVLGGKPARVALAPTESVSTLTRELERLEVSHRPTDLGGALALARSILEHLPQRDRKILLLSDLGDPSLTPGKDLSVVSPELARRVSDCAVIVGRFARERLEVDVVCSASAPKRPLTLELLETATASAPLARTRFQSAAQAQVVFGPETRRELLARARFVRLVETDDNSSNDLAPVLTESYELTIGLYADPVSSRVITGATTVLEQALRAVEPGWFIQSLSTVPEDPRGLAGLSVVLLDDPPPLSAETRHAITQFVEAGGTAIALFGPASATAQLGSLHLPFLEQRATWQSTAPPGLLPFTIDADPVGSAGLDRLSASGRFVFDESHDPRVEVRAKWQDDAPFWIERPLGRGTLVSLGLPSSVSLSDWALRPGFLAILGDLMKTSERRGAARVVRAGSTWQFGRDEAIEVLGPRGVLPITATDQQQVTPDRAGRYRVRRGSKERRVEEERIALYPDEEVLDEPHPLPVTTTDQQNQTSGRVDLSRYVVSALLGLLAIEVLLRTARRFGWSVGALGRGLRSRYRVARRR
jgi:hypothetical protein